MNNREIIKRIFQLYKIENPVQESMRGHMLVSRKKNLIAILKKTGKYGILAAAALKLLFELRKFGITATMSKVYALVVAGSIIAAASVSAATYVVIDRYFPGKEGIQKIESMEVKPDISRESVPTPHKEPQGGKPSELRLQYEKYKHMEKVTLKDGTVLIGTLIQKGEEVELITPNGTLKMSKEDIQGVIYLKPDEL